MAKEEESKSCYSSEITAFTHKHSPNEEKSKNEKNQNDRAARDKLIQSKRRGHV